MIKVIVPAKRVATGISVKRKKGRPSKPYVQAAQELISLWQRILLDAKRLDNVKQLGNAEPEVTIIKPIPLAKKDLVFGQTKNGIPEVEHAQVSTEFCRLAFSMIYPKIKPAELRTAINNALKSREWLYTEALEEFRSNDRFKEFIRAVATGEKNINQKQLFSLAYFLLVNRQFEEALGSFRPISSAAPRNKHPRAKAGRIASKSRTSPRQP
jgi:hypothetical protein